MSNVQGNHTVANLKEININSFQKRDFTFDTRGSASVTLQEGIIPFHSERFMPGQKYLERSGGSS